MIRAIPARVLRKVLLVIVRPEGGNPTNSDGLLPLESRTSRLSVDLTVVPAVDLMEHSRLASAGQH